MKTTDARQFVGQVIESHGGEAYWNSLEALDAEISASGFLFTAKHRRPLSHVRVRAFAREPVFTFFDFPNKGQTSELVGDQEVTIRDSDGRIAARRERPRSAFRGLRRQFVWDDLDFIYFAGYATWNYLTTPFLFLRPGFEFELLSPVTRDSASWSRLRVTFPDDIPTHSRTQLCYFDQDRYLRRLDYTASVVGQWAHGAHFCHGYRTFDEIKAPTSRRVRPLILGTYLLAWPTLVALDIHNIWPIALV